MVDIIFLIGLILGIFITVIGTKKQNKIFKYIGFILSIVCLIYILPQIFEGFINGFLDPILIFTYYVS